MSSPLESIICLTREAMEEEWVGRGRELGEKGKLSHIDYKPPYRLHIPPAKAVWEPVVYMRHTSLIPYLFDIALSPYLPLYPPPPPSLWGSCRRRSTLRVEGAGSGVG